MKFWTKVKKSKSIGNVSQIFKTLPPSVKNRSIISAFGLGQSVIDTHSD